jgi:thiamine pyrophosphate-dependent acetolactate synthase large subunit-like protein
LVNNSAMGNYETHIPKACERFGTKLLSGNYSEVARGLGAYTERIEHPGDITTALGRGVAATREGQPALLEFITCEEPDMAIP